VFDWELRALDIIRFVIYWSGIFKI
jgi:hypothetical protein